MNTKSTHKPVSLFKKVLYTVGFTATIMTGFVASLLILTIKPSPTSPSTVTQTESPTIKPAASTTLGLPVRISIPKINVDASIEQVGLDAGGAMAIQESQDTAAWYEPGPRPGQIGSAVLAGHYGELNGKWSVFSDLSQLRKGDILQVQDDTGTSLSFIVRESRYYDPKADAGEVFNSNDGKAHLNLITCEGSWNEAEETYSKRLVVFTDQYIQ